MLRRGVQKSDVCKAAVHLRLYWCLRLVRLAALFCLESCWMRNLLGMPPHSLRTAPEVTPLATTTATR